MLSVCEDCTGCMACLNRCPVGAIHAESDAYGFLMPVVNSRMCVDCGICDEVCPIAGKSSHIVADEEFAERQRRFKDEPNDRTMPLKAWSMYHKDECVVEKSSSGGAFYALASEVLKQDGIVFGCFYDTKQKEARLCSTEEVSLEDLLTSKYVESFVGDGFLRVEQELETGRQVLFCGTPCQAAGLVSFLGEKPENLLVADFSCGAVTSQKVLSEYLERLEQEYGSPVSGISFRDKHYGWGQYCMTVRFEDGKIYQKTAMEDPYFFCFLRSSMQRFSCHGCHFSNHHVSDLVLADFWRCYQFDVDHHDKKGLSLVLAMTDRGSRALSGLSGVMHMEELDPVKAAYQLVPKYSPDSKRAEIRRDQKMALEKGVSELRDSLLTADQKEWYANRQRVMDSPELTRDNPEIWGNGQIVY